MAASLPDLEDYYKFNFECTDIGGGKFNVSLAVARVDAYNADGTELGDGTRPGPRQLRRLGDKLAEFMGRVGWGPATLLSVEANTSTTVAVTLPAPD